MRFRRRCRKEPRRRLNEPVIGYRGWNYQAEGELHSMAMSYTWHPGVNTAKCLSNSFGVPADHDAPAPSDVCACGLYAWSNPASVTGCYVNGIIVGWGYIEAHMCQTVGFRAQYAEILALCPGRYITAVLPGLSARYNVPIIEPEMAMAYATEHGALLPRSLS